MAYRLALFDMDGTILHTLDDIKDSLNDTLTKKGFPARSMEEVRRFVGNGAKTLVVRALPNDVSEETIEDVLQTYQAHYQAHCNDQARPYDGVPRLLGALKEQGVLLAVVSNKPDDSVQKLADLHFKGLFDFTAGEQEGVLRKPAPDLVLRALDTLGVEKKDAVYIGDSEVDVATAQNATVKLIAVDWGFRDRDVLIANGAETIVSTPEEILNIICPSA